METSQSYKEGQLSGGCSFPVDEHKVIASDANELGQVWAKRKNPQWKPRRASVAACHHQQQLMALHYGYKTSYQFNLTSANIREMIVQKKLQHYQQQHKNDMNEIGCCTRDEVARKLEDLDIKCANDYENVPREASETMVAKEEEEEQRTAPTIVATHGGGSNLVAGNDMARTRSSAALSHTATNSKLAACKGRPESGAKWASDSFSSRYELNQDFCSRAAIEHEIGRAVSKLNALRQQKLSDSVTCCSELTDSETRATGSETDSVGDAVERRIASSECMNEELRLQDKQRRHVILSMAMKQMVAGHKRNSCGNKFPLGQESCQCSCRSRSCSVTLNRDAPSASASSTPNGSGELDDANAERTVRRLDTDSIAEVGDSVQNESSKQFETSDVRTRTSPKTVHEFVDISPHLKRRLSGQYEAKTDEARHKFRPKTSHVKSKHQHQGRNSINEDAEIRFSPIRQLVTGKNTPDCENYPNSGCQCLNPLIADDHLERAPDLRSGSSSDQFPRKRALNEMVAPRRSRSAMARDGLGHWQNSSHRVSDQTDEELEALIVESWLDDHPEFTRDYIMRKATRQVVDEWLVANAKVSNTNVSSHLDLRSIHTISRPVSQISLGSYAKESSWRGSQLNTSEVAECDIQSATFGTMRVNRSNSQSASVTSRGQGLATPIRKISATDFEARTGNGFLRPMLSRTPDGRLTFLPQSSMVAARVSPVNLDEEARVSKKADSYQSSPSDRSDAMQSSGSSATMALGRTSGSEDSLHEASWVEPNKTAPRPDDEVKLIFELVENIYDDLDIRTLLHKILKNIAVLINADRSSLFLVCGGPNDPNRRLVSQLFNVDQDSIDVGEPEESITIPWGTGLVGFVAASGEAVNINNCYEDPRFTDAIDQRTGYVTKHMLCAPILDKRNEIVGVAQVINKRDGNAFSKADELKFMRYLQFCGIGLRNAQSYEQCQLENRRNQVLLDLARMVFEEQSTIEQVVYRIMLHTQSLLDCERCQVLLIDDGNDELEGPSNQFPSYRCSMAPTNDVSAWKRADDCSQSRTHPAKNASPRTEMRHDDPEEGVASSESDGLEDDVGPQLESPKLFSLVFDLECDSNDPVIHSNKEDSNSKCSKEARAFPLNIGITGYVAMTGETLNIENAHQHDRFDVSVDEGSDFKHRSILCMPIRNGRRRIIGVIQFVNKKNGQPFNKNDEDLFEAFAIFCGLGIHNTLMYERVLKVMAKQRVTFEVLSYHATAPLEEAKKLSQEQIPSCFALNLASLKFNDFSLDEQYMLKSCLRFFLDLDLMRRFQIDHLVLCNWILSVQKNYRKITYHPIVGGDGLKASPVRYHNWRHAFNVSQMMFAILVNTQICQALGELETLALLIACLCHDLDHRGTNNSFQIKSASPLAELYSTSTMEHHHFDQCVMILNSQGNQILSNLSPEEYSRVIILLEEAILATDLANYFRNRDNFFQLVNGNKFDWHNDPKHRSLLRCMLMTACDVAAITKPWPIQKVVADLVMSEFYQQGDIEKNELNIEPIDMMNRDKMSELPSMQISFIDNVCAPIYTAFAKLFPHELSTLLDGCLSNRNLWQEVGASLTPSDEPSIDFLKCDHNKVDEKQRSLMEVEASNSKTMSLCELQDKDSIKL